LRYVFKLLKIKTKYKNPSHVGLEIKTKNKNSTYLALFFGTYIDKNDDDINKDSTTAGLTLLF
jgi:hypothetical protein